MGGVEISLPAGVPIFAVLLVFVSLTTLLAYFRGGRGVLIMLIALSLAYFAFTWWDYRGTGHQPWEYSRTGIPSGWGDIFLELTPYVLGPLWVSGAAVYAVLRLLGMLPGQRNGSR